MFAASKTDSVSAVGPEPFNYVTMLLHGDGTNGAQNNTFLDSSTNNFTITRNGNTTQGSFSPYGSNWSNFFNGSSGLSCNVSGISAGTSTFTFEAWVYLTTLASASTLYDTRVSNSGTTTAMSVGIFATSGNIKFYDGGADNDLGGGITANAWTHVAIVRNSSNVITAYINGTATGTTVSSTRNFTDNYFWIASVPNPASPYLNGYMSNLRWVVGTAVYTSNFTPSTTPLTAITNTKLLTCQSNRFVDNSSNAFTVTPSGSPSVQRFNPFGTATAYSTSVIGGSAYIDNNGYVDCGSQSAYAFGTGDFTINAWIYPTSLVNYVVILDTRGSGGSAGFAFAMDGAKTIYFYSAVSFSVVVTSAVGAVPLNAWTYATVTRTSGTNRLYLNGVLVNTASNSDNYSHTALTCGYSAAGGGERYYGYMSDVQVIKGTAVAPTLPTAPVATSSGTSVLLNMQNAAIFDNAMMNDLVTVGNAQISTSVKKYGTGSLYFDGTGDNLNTRASPNLAFGTGDFTIECWVYANDVTSLAGIYDGRGPGETPTIVIQSGTFKYFTNGGFQITSSSISTSTWYHLAVSRSGTSTKLFVNGVQGGSTYTDSTNYVSTTPSFVGSLYDGSSLNGYIDDLRITKGYARYTANFTAPTSALSDTGPY